MTNLADTSDKFTRNAKVCGYLVLDCALRVLIGGAGNLRARGHFILNSFGALNWTTLNRKGRFCKHSLF